VYKRTIAKAEAQMNNNWTYRATCWYKAALIAGLLFIAFAISCLAQTVEILTETKVIHSPITREEKVREGTMAIWRAYVRATGCEWPVSASTNGLETLRPIKP